MRFFFNDTATAEIYTLSLHGALPISSSPRTAPRSCRCVRAARSARKPPPHRSSRAATSRHPSPTATSPGRERARPRRSEEHTSELQSRQYLVCRLLLEKKKILITLTN